MATSLILLYVLYSVYIGIYFFIAYVIFPDGRLFQVESCLVCICNVAVICTTFGTSHCKQTCISTTRINDSKPKQIVNLNKQLFGVRIGVWT